MEPKVIDFIDVVHAEFGTIVWLGKPSKEQREARRW